MNKFIGKEQVWAYFKTLFEQVNAHVALHGDTGVEVSNDLAFAWGNATLSMTPKAEGPTTTVDAKWLDVLKRQADGSWKIHRDSVTNNGPPTVE